MTTALADALKKVQAGKVKGVQVTVVKANGMKEAFDPEKLRGSLLRSGASQKAIEEVVAHIEAELYDGVTTTDIYRHAFDYLRTVEKPVARRYSLRRAILDLGPSGFPFEDFVAEVLHTKGLECVTRQTVLGSCVPHEVDVVAWNETKLIMCEVKFHNELGIKSDLKVALYVKARFDDLKENTFNYGGKERQMTDGWLITNTKFSSTAIHYAECKDLTLIGWNYPAEGNLEDLILEGKLHPITCLTTLKESDKNTLLSNNVVLCSTLRNDPSLFSSLLGPQFDAQPVLEEINEL